MYEIYTIWMDDSVAGSIKERELVRLSLNIKLVLQLVYKFSFLVFVSRITKVFHESILFFYFNTHSYLHFQGL